MTDRNPQPSTFDGPIESGVDHSRPRTLLDPCLVGVLAAVISLAGAGRPSFWYDEAATMSASYSRSLAQLWQMLGNVDAVEGLYYVLMHGWFTIFPPTEFWSRAPSGLAVGGAAAGVVVLSKQFVVAQRRNGLRSCVRDLAADNVGGYRSSPVCPVDDGRGVADGAARVRRTA